MTASRRGCASRRGRAARLALALALALVLPAPARAQGKADAWVLRAAGQMADGQLVAAISSLGRARAIKASPEQDALVGLAALQGGELAAAQRNIDAAITRGSTEPLVFYWAARIELARGQVARALKRLQEALAVGGDQPQLRMAQAVVLATLGRRPAALTALEAVAARRPNLLDPSLYPAPVEGAVALVGRMMRRIPGRLQLRRTQGHLLWRAGRVLAAQRHFVALLQERKGDSDALQMLARCQVALRRTERAVALANQAVLSAPKSAQALATRGEILLELGRAAAAAKDLRKAADAFPRDARLLARVAEACTEAERPTCAAKFFRYTARRDPTIAAAHFGSALHLQQAGEKAKATAAFERAVALAPDNPRYAKGAAAHAMRQGDRRRAAALLAQARRADRVHRRRARALTRSSRAFKAQIDAMEALATAGGCKSPRCQQTLARSPEPARSFMRAHLALKAGHKGQARAYLIRVVPGLKVSRLLNRDPLIPTGQAKYLKKNALAPRIVFPLVPAYLLR